MKKILILGAGGPAGVLLTRCLKDFDVYGTDDGVWASKMIEAKTDNVIPDLIFPLPDNLIVAYATCPQCFLPDQKEIELCQDKPKLVKVLRELAPKTIWERETKGAGGKGSRMGSEYLPGRNISCEMIFKNGKLEAYFQKHRLSYLVKKVEPRVFRGIGSSAVAKCIDDREILDVSLKAVSRISRKPQGIYAVDLREDEYGNPKITEINAGRFLTASYVFYYKAYNLPKLFVELALGLKKSKLGEYPEGKGIIRQIDQEPYFGEL